MPAEVVLTHNGVAPITGTDAGSIYFIGTATVIIRYAFEVPFDAK